MLLNKTLANKGDKLPLSCVMLVQNLVTLMLIYIFDAILSDKTKNSWKMKIPAFRVRTCILWLPVNIFFLTMLYSGFITLNKVSVSLVSVCKNVTNVFTTMGDRLLFGEPVSLRVIFALMLMILAAYIGAADELYINNDEFNVVAAIAMSVNCLSTSAYGLQIKMSQKKTKLSPYGCTFYNALAATPICFFWTLSTGELQQFISHPGLTEPRFLFSLIMSSLIGFGIGFSVFWCISATSPTTYAMVGAANKIPLSLMGIVLFSEPITVPRVLFISVGLLAGIVYAHAKALLKEQSAKKNDDNNKGTTKKPVSDVVVEKVGMGKLNGGGTNGCDGLISNDKQQLS